jgi:hypothetical protein
MRAILIDPFACTVTEIDHDHTSHQSIYPALSHETMPVDCFDVVRLAFGDGIYIDDEGLLKSPARFFCLNDYHDDEGTLVPLAGKGLILGSDAEGETIGAKVPLAWVLEQVIFMAIDGAGRFAPTRAPWTPTREEQNQ